MRRKTISRRAICASNRHVLLRRTSGMGNGHSSCPMTNTALSLPSEQVRGNKERLIMMTSSVASECFIVTGLHASRELEIVLNRGVGRPPKVPPAGPGRHCRPWQELAADPGSKGVNSKFASKRNQGPATLPKDRRENAPIKQAWVRRHEQHCLAAIEMLDH